MSDSDEEPTQQQEGSRSINEIGKLSSPTKPIGREVQSQPKPKPEHLEGPPPGPISASMPHGPGTGAGKSGSPQQGTNFLSSGRQRAEGNGQQKQASSSKNSGHLASIQAIAAQLAQRDREILEETAKLKNQNRQLENEVERLKNALATAQNGGSSSEMEKLRQENEELKDLASAQRVLDEGGDDAAAIELLEKAKIKAEKRAEKAKKREEKLEGKVRDAKEAIEAARKRALAAESAAQEAARAKAEAEKDVVESWQLNTQLRGQIKKLEQSNAELQSSAAASEARAVAAEARIRSLEEEVKQLHEKTTLAKETKHKASKMESWQRMSQLLEGKLKDAERSAAVAEKARKEAVEELEALKAAVPSVSGMKDVLEEKQQLVEWCAAQESELAALKTEKLKLTADLAQAESSREADNAALKRIQAQMFVIENGAKDRQLKLETLEQQLREAAKQLKADAAKIEDLEHRCNANHDWALYEKDRRKKAEQARDAAVAEARNKNYYNRNYSSGGGDSRYGHHHHKNYHNRGGAFVQPPPPPFPPPPPSSGGGRNDLRQDNNTWKKSPSEYQKSNKYINGAPAHQHRSNDSLKRSRGGEVESGGSGDGGNRQARKSVGNGVEEGKDGDGKKRARKENGGGGGGGGGREGNGME